MAGSLMAYDKDITVNPWQVAGVAQTAKQAAVQTILGTERQALTPFDTVLMNFYESCFPISFNLISPTNAGLGGSGFGRVWSNVDQPLAIFLRKLAKSPGIAQPGIGSVKVDFVRNTRQSLAIDSQVTGGTFQLVIGAFTSPDIAVDTGAAPNQGQQTAMNIRDALTDVTGTTGQQAFAFVSTDGKIQVILAGSWGGKNVAKMTANTNLLSCGSGTCPANPIKVNVESPGGGTPVPAIDGTKKISTFGFTALGDLSAKVTALTKIVHVQVQGASVNLPANTAPLDWGVDLTWTLANFKTVASDRLVRTVTTVAKGTTTLSAAGRTLQSLGVADGDALTITVSN